MKVELLRAWPRRFERIELELQAGATVSEAVIAAGWGADPEAVAYAVFGQRVDGDAVLRDGDRIELLRPLDRKSTRLNSSHCEASRMPSSA